MGVAGRIAKALGLRREVFALKAGNILFLSRHPVLAQMAGDIARGLDPDFVSRRPVVVYCGAHHRFGWHLLRRGLKIGIQTEQLYDEAGQRLWAAEDKIVRRILSILPRLDVLVDINEANRPVYERLPAAEREKVLFGPHIFPHAPPPATGHELERCVFFGAMASAHRQRIVPPLAARGLCDVVEGGVYGEALFDRIRRYRAVLNVHFAEGVYTEYPRLLTALVQGKPVVSERLSSRLTENVHYVGLDAVETADYPAVYVAFAGHMCAHYSFQALLQRLEREG